jgi:hypothetical protein
MFLHSLISVVMFFSTSAALAVDSPSASAPQIESMLERLEKRLRDREISPLMYESGTKNTPSQVIEAPAPATIKGSTPGAKELQQVDRDLNDLEQKLENVEGDLQKLKQQTVENSTTANRTDIAVNLVNYEKEAIGSLYVKLDGYTVYDQKQSSGLWMPSHKIPLFSGPLEAGIHRLDIEVSTMNKAPHSPDVRSVRKSFDIKIPAGISKANLVVNLNNDKGTLSADMHEAKDTL